MTCHFSSLSPSPKQAEDELSLLSLGAHLRRQQASNESQLPFDIHKPMPSMVSSVITNRLPEAMMLLHHQTNATNNNRNSLTGAHLISSVVVAQQHSNDSTSLSNSNNNNIDSNNNNNNWKLNHSRHSRQATIPTTGTNNDAHQRFAIIQPANTDILVRLVGHWHAKCALQYFLCYLLSSSITILICLRLARMCSWKKCELFGLSLCSHKLGQKFDGKDVSQNHRAHTENTFNGKHNLNSTNCGFYYRTRLGE